jgi:TrmH family RNA methyltransferase
MGNLGTIARTMVGFEVRNLALVRPAVDIFDPRVVRSSMGAVFKLAFQYFDAFSEYTSLFSHNVYPFMTNGKANLDKTNFQEPFALVFGNESSGLTDEYQMVGTSVTIPYNSRDIDSLSLPVAVGIALYAARKALPR